MDEKWPIAEQPIAEGDGSAYWPPRGGAPMLDARELQRQLAPLRMPVGGAAAFERFATAVLPENLLPEREALLAQGFRAGWSQALADVATIVDHLCERA